MQLRDSISARLSPLMLLAFIGWLQWTGGEAQKDGGIVSYPCNSGALGPVIFSHRSHGIRGAGYSCNKCHNGASTKPLAVEMDEIRQGRACGACHDGSTKGPSSRQAASPVQDCASCHMPAADIVFKLNRMDPVSFSHIKHLAVGTERKTTKPIGFSCSDCHPAPFARVAKGPLGMEVPHEVGACAQCHNGRKRSDGLPSAFAANTRCLTCHKSPEPLSPDTLP
jgi:c(7)-type cytochrome triheme protein